MKFLKSIGVKFRRSFISGRAASLVLLVFFFFSLTVSAQNKFEDRQISSIDITFEGADRDLSAAEQFRLIAREALGDTYSLVRVRDALQKLYDTDRIVSATVEATNVGSNSVNVRFIIKRKTQAERISIEVGNTVGDTVTEQELLLRLNLIEPGTAITEQTLRNNAELILTYLRERGFFNAEVTFTQEQLENETRVAVTFQVNPNAQAKVENFRIDIEGFNETEIIDDLELQAGALFSRADLTEDVEKIREALRETGFLAPQLTEPRVVYDSDKNTISITLEGKVGPTVEVSVEAEGEKVGDKTQTRLLPIKREGTLDYSAIVEGARRLRNYFQEHGYFFAEVTPVCSVNPPFKEDEAVVTTNETEMLCSALSGVDLTNRTVEVKYQADLNRQLRLVDIRLEGTDKLSIPEIATVLESQEQSLISFIPYLGYGRGYTSAEILEEDRQTVASLMRELGYRDATVGVKQGVSPNGEDLIITFVVDEGPLTRISNVEIVGNSAFSDAVLQNELPNLVGKSYSRAKARNGAQKISAFYAQQGYYDAKIVYSIEEVPTPPDAPEEMVRVVYTIEIEGKKVFINRILINGNEDTKREAILKAINLQPDGLLRSTDIFSSEQNLYATSAFERVEIKPEPAGENAEGNRLTDVIINVEEQKPRLITYGGGFSTDLGLSGFFDIRHFNLFGRLQQGGARVRWSQRQQLVQFDFLNPRFLPDGRDKNGNRRFAPLTFTAQYQRDSTVTRFFRSAFDQGTFGIVQRIDEEGNPIDEFGNPAGDPTINRLTLSAETSRTISESARSVLFVRYRFEDVRLFNIESLLIRDLLRPDAKIRISGFGATFVRDTRQNCSVRYTLLDMIAKGEPGEPCRYNASDPTKGSYLTAEYNVSLPALGANIGFQKFQASLYKFYTFPALKNTTLAGRAVIGLANVFSTGNRFQNSQFPDLEGVLPISERFFAGGSTTLRGFDFESAGPRIAIVPEGTFRNQNGEIVTLNPFTVPFGGNGLAIINLEARIPLTETVRAVPFYDGGNVFRRVGDIFNPPDVPADDVFRQNLRAIWTNTVGLGFRIKTPIGGEFAVDYGYLLNPPRFLIPQGNNAPNAVLQLKKEHFHFRFTQAF